MSKKQEHLLTNKSASDRSYGETCSGNVDYRIPDTPHSTVQQQDTNRREAVKKLIQQFENHPNKESFLQGLNKTEEINKFSEESKKLITDMGNTEIVAALHHSERSSGRLDLVSRLRIETFRDRCRVAVGLTGLRSQTRRHHAITQPNCTPHPGYG